MIAPLPPPGPDDAFFIKLNGILALRFSEENLTVGQIARAVALSEDLLLNKIKKERGLTTEQYLLRFRLDRAMEIIAATDRSMKEITHLIGLNDAAHFSRAFKNQFGINPTEFRQKQREIANISGI